MNLDALYSELTLKTNAKLVLLVLDGLGDLAAREQNNLTPLEAAATPNLDALAKDSAQGRRLVCVLITDDRKANNVRERTFNEGFNHRTCQLSDWTMASSRPSSGNGPLV